MQEGVLLQPAPPMGWGPALHGMSPCSPGQGFPAAEEAPQELGCALTQSRQPVQQQHFYRNKENFIPLLPPWITSLFPEHPGADNWPKIRAAGAGASGSALALLPQPVICMQSLHYVPGKRHTRAKFFLKATFPWCLMTISL